ncbi:hypothetical protein BCR39DRAFT_343948 [Naematelia encephala]|uniref:Uncharacterized protein n=1 Tax=Naematelia encephala TaxID=71784 RepID=A0A1Y2AMF8_9TREE|nr:hypothetical protein BCR39DRAFT_343948 [Naematelia encephala]
MITVGAREASELQSIHHYAKEKSLVLSRETLFGRKPTMDDLQGLLVLFMWVMGVRLPGQAIAVAHELDLTATCGRLCGLALEQGELSPAMEKQLMDTMRTYAYLFQLDILSSMVAAKPKMLVSGDFAEYSGLLLRQAVPRLSDVRLAAQIELNKLISLAQEAIDPAGFSATPNRQPPRLDTISSYNDALDHWFDKWQKHISAPNFVGQLGRFDAGSCLHG